LEGDKQGKTAAHLHKLSRFGEVTPRADFRTVHPLKASKEDLLRGGGNERFTGEFLRIRQITKRERKGGSLKGFLHRRGSQKKSGRGLKKLDDCQREERLLEQELG